MSPPNHIDVLRLEAKRAFEQHDIELALTLNEELASHNLPEGYFTCGVIYENYALEHEDPGYLDKAWQHYFKLMTEFDDSEGYVGCARIILAREDGARAELAERYCRYAIERDGNPFAYLVLGRVYEAFFLPEKARQAMHAYWGATWRGAAFGMRGFARMHWRYGSKTVAVSVHVIATFFFPLFRLFGGSRALRPG